MYSINFLDISSIVVFFVCISLFIQLMRGAPYVPSQKDAVANMIALTQPVGGEKMIDLGSGDGRIVIAFAKAGVEAHGYENNFLLAWFSRRKIKKMGLEDVAFIHCKSFWKVDFYPFSIVTLFGISHIMNDLEKKLKKELKTGARIASNAFRFSDWELAEKKGSVLLYKI